MKHPGRLAARLLQRMQEATARGLGGPTDAREQLTPKVALNHVLTILLPNLGGKVGVRTTRELKTLGLIMDHLSMSNPSRAADVVAQRIKALEKATIEGHWGQAQHIELLPPENTLLIEKDEETFAAREYLLEQKLRQYERGPQRKEAEGKGKGKSPRSKGKGEAKGDKGTWEKTPKAGEAK